MRSTFERLDTSDYRAASVYDHGPISCIGMPLRGVLRYAAALERRNLALAFENIRLRRLLKEVERRENLKTPNR